MPQLPMIGVKEWVPYERGVGLGIKADGVGLSDRNGSGGLENGDDHRYVV
jgi:hypothetical protein